MIPTNVQFPKKAGIYRIRNKKNNKFYLGSSLNCRKRQREHLQMLRLGKHHSRQLQHAWNKHGEDSFVWEIVEFINDDDNILVREQYYLDILECNVGYNVNCYSTGQGKKLSENTKEKLARILMLKQLEKNSDMGITIDRRHNTFRVQIKLNRKRKYLGSFNNIDDARKIRNKHYEIAYSIDADFWLKLQPLLGNVWADVPERNLGRGKYCRSAEVRQKLSLSKMGKPGHKLSMENLELLLQSHNTVDAKNKKRKTRILKMFISPRFYIHERIRDGRKFFEVYFQLDYRTIWAGTFNDYNSARSARNTMVEQFWIKEDPQFWYEILEPIFRESCLI